MSDEELIQEYQNKLGDDYTVTIDNQGRVQIRDGTVDKNGNLNGCTFSMTIPRDGNVENCFTYIPGGGDNLTYIQPNDPKREVTMYTHQYYANSVMGDNAETAVFVVSSAKGTTVDSAIVKYNDILNKLDMNDTNKIFDGYSNGGMQAIKFASNYENSTVIMNASSFTNGVNSDYYKALSDNGGQVIYLIDQKPYDAGGPAILSSVKQAGIPLYVIAGFPYTHNYMPYTLTKYNTVGFVLGDSNSPLAVAGDGNVYSILNEDGNPFNCSFYRFDYNSMKYVPISPSEMQYELNHYKPDRYDRLNYLRRLEIFNVNNIPDFASYVDSHGKTVIISNCKKSTNYVNEIRSSIVTTHVDSFPNISGGFNAVSQKIESLIDSYINSTQAMYDKIIDITQKTVDVTSGYKTLDETFTQEIIEEEL